jgi:hypothetical protein
MLLIPLQRWYYPAGGLWPLVHLRSFEAVAAPKLTASRPRCPPGRVTVGPCGEVDLGVALEIVDLDRSARPAGS